jgi:two-component system cell cycle response regulator
VRLLEFVASLAAMAIKNARVFSEARDRANTDGLTRLATHRHFQDTFDAELRRAERYGDFLSVVITDIDHFKKFNDTYGHQIGDLVLRETAAVFRAAVRDMDLVARYGGEEFACILPNTNKAGAVKLAERLRQAVEARQYQTERGVLRVAISLGVATFPVDAKEKVQLIKLADGALYQAKESGRNRVCYANQRTPDPTA